MRFRISRRANNDLNAIWDHVARDSAAAADKVEADLHAAMRLLAEFPGLGHGRREVKDARYRFWRVHSYLVAYRLDGRTLVVVRVLHGARDLRQVFPPRP
jgi:plasmid stabilization system protein ParE